VQALDNGRSVDEVSTAERTQQVLVDIVDATGASTGHGHLPSRLTSRLSGGRRRLDAAAAGTGCLHQTPSAAALQHQTDSV